MKNLKKVLALVVVFAMMMSTLAFAAGFPDVAADADYANAINVLSDLGFFTGDDKGNFNPDATITRAEYAVVVCRILGLNAAGVSEFADVAADHWATGYVNAASQAGIIKGYGNGNFGPSDPVKYEEAVTMLVRALGYEPLAISKGNWPQGHISVASSYGLLTAVDGSVGEGAKRSAVAAMTYNALDIPVVEQTGFGTDVQYTIMKQTDDQDKVTLLTKLDVFKADGIVVSNAKVAYGAHANGDLEKGYIQVKVTDDYDNPDKALRLEDNKNGKIKEENGYLIDLRDEADLAADYIASNVTVYFEKYATGKYDLVAIEAAAGAEVLALDLADINGATTDFDTDFDEKPVIKYYKEGASKTTNAYLEVPVTVDEETVLGYNVVLNDELLSDDDLDDVLEMIAEEELVGNVELIDWDNDSKYDVIDITSYIHVIVEEVDAKNGIISTYNDIRIDLDIENDEALVTVKDVNGADVDFATLKEYDVLALAVSPSPILNGDELGDASYKSLDIITLGQSKVEGIIKGEGTTSAGDAIYTIAGNKYEYEASMVATDDVNYMENALEVSAEGTFFLGINGKIVGFEGAKAADGNYAFIIGAYGTRASNATLTLLTEAGIKTFTYADKVKFANAATDDYDRVSVKDTCDNLTVLAGTAWDGLDDYTVEVNDEDVSASIYAALAALYNEETTEVAMSDDEAAARLIQYNTNAAGEITEILPMVIPEDGLANIADETKAGNEYKDATQKLAGKNIADDVVVFDIDWDDLTLSTVKDLSFLVDESEYAYLLYNKNDDNQYEAMVVLDSESAFAMGTPLAIVKEVETGINDETDADTQTLTVVVNGEEKVIVVDEEETKEGLGDFDFGTIILYNADSTGLVNSYAVVGNATLTYAAGEMTAEFAFDSDFVAAATTEYNVDARTAEEGDAYFYGYYVNKTTKTLDINVENAIANKVVEVDEEEVVVPVSGEISLPGYAKAQLYQFTSTGRTKELEIGGGVAGLTKCDDEDDTIKNYVLVRTVDGAIQEVIGFDFDVLVD